MREANLPCAEWLLKKGAKADGRPRASTIYQACFPRRFYLLPSYHLPERQALRHRHEHMLYHHGARLLPRFIRTRDSPHTLLKENPGPYPEAATIIHFEMPTT